MVSLLLAVLLSGVTSEQEMQQGYLDAYKHSVAEDKPLMVVVGAPWCPACKVLKDTTIRAMAKSGELDEVSLVMVNRDEDPELAEQLTKGEQLIPQIIVYTKSESGRWQRRRLMGFQSQQPIRSLIRKALGRG